MFLFFSVKALVTVTNLWKNQSVRAKEVYVEMID